MLCPPSGRRQDGQPQAANPPSTRWLRTIQRTTLINHAADVFAPTFHPVFNTFSTRFQHVFNTAHHPAMPAFEADFWAFRHPVGTAHTSLFGQACLILLPADPSLLSY
jgi:hypothetical protein